MYETLDRIDAIRTEIAKQKLELEALEKRAEELKRKAETEQAEPQPWKPKKGETYWCIFGSAEPSVCVWDDDDIDHQYRDAGNCFPTKERATQVAEKVKILLRLEQLHDMFCPDYVPDWSRNSGKYCVYYSRCTNTYQYNVATYFDRGVGTYYDSEETAQKVCDILNAEGAQP